MKKFLTLFLALCLLMGVCIAETTITGDGEGATGQTLVTLTVDRSMDSYTVTIPPTVIIDPATKKGSMSITLNKGFELISCNSLSIKMKSNNDCVLINEDGTQSVEYWIYLNSAPQTACNYGGGLTTLLTVNKGADATIDRVYEMTPQIRYDLPTAGVYTDTLTFTVSVS